MRQIQNFRLCPDWWLTTRMAGLGFFALIFALLLVYFLFTQPFNLLPIFVIGIGFATHATAFKKFLRLKKLGGGTAVALSPEGFCDVRISPNLIPWSAVESVTLGRFFGPTSVDLKVTEECIRDLYPSNFKLVTYYMTDMGRRRISSSHQYLGIGIYELFEAVSAYYHYYHERK